MSEFSDFARRIHQFLETDGSEAKRLAYDLTRSKLSEKQIMSLLWSFLSISKSASLFNENSTNLICMILYEIAEINSEFTNLLYITLDKVDLDRINVDNNLIDKSSFNKSLRLSNSKKFNITKYQYMEKNPEGFACLLLALMKNRANDLVQIIGEHNLDPDSVLLILIDLIGFKNAENTKKFYQMLPQFDVNRTINMLVQKIDQNYMPGHIQILFYLFDSEMIPIEKQIPILSHLSSVLEKLKSLLSDAAEKFCKYIRRPRTIIPGEPKYSKDWLKMQKQYLDAHDILYKSPHFRIEFSTIEIDKIFKYAQYDPCSIPELAEYVTNYLANSLENDPNNFFKNDTNMQLISILSCHCTSNKLIASMCQLEQIPAHVFVNFMLPSMSMSNCGWQLSEIIFNKMSSLFTFSERCQIYRRLDIVYNTIIDLRVLSASVAGKTANIMKRITTKNDKKIDREGDEFSYKFSKLLIKAPHVVANALIKYIKDNIPTPPAEVLIRVLCDSSRFTNDIILWRFTDAINDVKHETKSEFISLPESLTLWPKFIGEFLGKFANKNFHSFDLKGYLYFILDGLKQDRISHVCLFSNLLTETTGIYYNGQMTSADIEIKSCESLSRINRSIESSSDIQQIQHDFKNILISSDDNFALNILCLLDSMHLSMKFIELLPDISDAPDRIDDIQFTFISLCEFMESNNWKPKELITNCHFSYPSAFHISRTGNEIDLNDEDDDDESYEPFIPMRIPVDLFTSFWKYGLKELHFPKLTFEKRLKSIEESIQTANEETKNKLELIKFKIKSSMENQETKNLEIKKRLKLISQEWFDESLNADIYQNFVHSCIMKRIKISQEDSVYSSKFIYLICHTSYTFDFRKFVLEFLRIFHFYIFSSTVTEAKLFGIFMKKILKFIRRQGDYDEEAEIHGVLMEKVALLIERKEDFLVIANTVHMLNMIQKYFPKRTEHKKAIYDSLKNNAELYKGSYVESLLNVYLPRVAQMLKDKEPSRPASPPPLKPMPKSKHGKEDKIEVKIVESINDENENEINEEVTIEEEEVQEEVEDNRTENGEEEEKDENNEQNEIVDNENNDDDGDRSNEDNENRSNEDDDESRNNENENQDENENNDDEERSNENENENDEEGDENRENDKDENEDEDRSNENDDDDRSNEPNENENDDDQRSVDENNELNEEEDHHDDENHEDENRDDENQADNNDEDDQNENQEENENNDDDNENQGENKDEDGGENQEENEEGNNNNEDDDQNENQDENQDENEENNSNNNDDGQNENQEENENSKNESSHRRDEDRQARNTTRERKDEPRRTEKSSQNSSSSNQNQRQAPRQMNQSRRDNRDARDNRDSRDTRDSRDKYDNRNKYSNARDKYDSRDIRTSSDSRDRSNSDSRDKYDSRDIRDKYDNRDTRNKYDNRDNRDSRDNRDGRSSSDSRDGRTNSDSRDKYDSRDSRSISDSRDRAGSGGQNRGSYDQRRRDGDRDSRGREMMDKKDSYQQQQQQRMRSSGERYSQQGRSDDRNYYQSYDNRGRSNDRGYDDSRRRKNDKMHK